jgi:hypothetical protein
MDRFLTQNNVVEVNTFNKYIANLISIKKVDILEYSYLSQCKGSIVNINWFCEIINKIGDIKLNKICDDSFSNLLKYDNAKNIIYCDIDKILLEFFNNKKDKIIFTTDQHHAISTICNFLTNHNSKTFGLYGYAGTGKTSTFVEIIGYLISTGLLNNIAFTAPTNKAVNIIKSKFRNQLRDIAYIKLKKKLDIDFNFEDILDELYISGIKIDFITIHRLLNYKTDYDIEGDRIFIRGGKSTISSYDFIVVDECSMLPFQIVSHLFEEIYISNMNSSNKYKRIPKILFSGDAGQLPPVNEDISTIFIKEYQKFNSFIYNTYETLDGLKLCDKNELDNCLNILKNNIVSMKYIVLKEVVRNTIPNVVNLCNNIRQWLENIIDVPTPHKFIGNGVHVYKHIPNSCKTDSVWFKTFIKKHNENQTDNIILTWTNKQCDEYNNMVRKIVFSNKDKIDEYEIGDILILNDFYTLDEVTYKNRLLKDCKDRFYTSEQIKVVDVEKTVKKNEEFSENIKIKTKNFILLEGKYKNFIKSLNKKFSREYETWKIYTNRLIDTTKQNIIAETHHIYVIHGNSVSKLDNEKMTCMKLIRKFRDILMKDNRDQAGSIDKNIIRPLWKEWNKIFIEPFAKVTKGNALSTHKSQASSFFNVFIDVDDILNNNNCEEAKRCLYTALTRASNEIHLLC